MQYLLDTCVVSELTRPSPHAGVVGWLEARDEESIYLSVLTVGKLQRGICRLRQGKRRNDLQRWLDFESRDRFLGRLIEIDEEIATTWGRIQARADTHGRPIPAIDGLLGATAVTRNLTIVTRDETDLSRTGARIFNPWNA